MTTIELRLPATVHLTVDLDAGRVAKVTILPAQSVADFGAWDDHGRPELVEAAIKIADETVWEPLLHLPDGLSWEA